MKLYQYAVLALGLAVVGPASAANVLPTLGGDQETPATGAPMKHAAIDFDGSAISVHLDDAVATPRLRELSPPNTFDPAEAWSVLTGKAHNFQYGWLPASAWAPPAGLGVFVEQLSASPGLEVYEGGRFMSEATVRAMTFDPLFENGEPWQWSGLMTHNAYAVANPTEPVYEATYRVFLADATTGVEPVDTLGAPLYGSGAVTFTWAATPVPEPTAAALVLAACLAALRRR